jgi:hypothetical protein
VIATSERDDTPIGGKPTEQPEHDDTVDLLGRLRSGGPWVLTAIGPDGVIKTSTAHTTALLSPQPTAAPAGWPSRRTTEIM